MPKKKSWSKEDLFNAVRDSRSIRQVLKKLGLAEAGGNYSQVRKYIKLYNIGTEHLKGKGWSRGIKTGPGLRKPLSEIMKKDSSFQSYKLKTRLFDEGKKKMKCELCGWAQKSPDGRLPLELDHINGDSRDNRLDNLRILCPNCHSLQPTHRGLNRRRKNEG